MNIKRSLTTTAITLSLVTASVLMAASPAMAAPKVYSKSFYDWGKCVSFAWNPPKGIHPDPWHGCSLAAPGRWTVWYTKS